MRLELLSYSGIMALSSLAIALQLFVLDYIGIPVAASRKTQQRLAYALVPVALLAYE